MNVQEKSRIFLSSPHMSEQGYEQEYIKEAFDTNWVAPLGKNVDEFEREMMAKTGAKAAVALTTGTSAIHLALKTVGVEKGDIVFCQSLTFSATANPIIYQGAIPVFIDSETDTWNMSPDALEVALKKYPNVKAVIVVHLYGIPANLKRIVALCNQYNVPLIEDAAESLGSIYEGKYTGTYGHLGIYSFNGNKIITTSGGGMLLFNGDNAEEEAKKARFWATQSRDPAKHYQHSEIGYNYRMSNIVAGIGRGQLKVLDERVEKKRYIYKYYYNHLADLDGLTFMPLFDGANCWLTSILLLGKVKPHMVMNALDSENIESRPIWKPMHLQPVFAGYDYIDNGSFSQNIFENGLCLPSDTKMTNSDLDRIILIIKRLW